MEYSSNKIQIRKDLGEVVRIVIDGQVTSTTDRLFYYYSIYRLRLILSTIIRFCYQDYRIVLVLGTLLLIGFIRTFTHSN